MTLTLVAALNHARGTNPTYRQAVNSAGLNGGGAAHDLVRPGASAGARLNLFNTQFTGNLTRQGFDNFGNPIANPVSDWRYFSQTDQSLDLTWAIQGASIFNALDRQKLTNLDRDIAETGALTTLDIAVRRAYWDALEQSELARAEEELLEARRVDHQVAERLFSLAMRTRVDVLNAELGIEQQQLALQRQRAAFEKAKLALRTTLGDEDLGPFRLGEEAPSSFDPALLDARRARAPGAGGEPEVAPGRGRRAQRRSRTRGEQADLVAAADPQLAGRPPCARTDAGRTRSSTSRSTRTWTSSFYVGCPDADVQQLLPEPRSGQPGRRWPWTTAGRRSGTRASRCEEGVRGALLELSSPVREPAPGRAFEGDRRRGPASGAGGVPHRAPAPSRTCGRPSRHEADTRRQVIQARYAFVDALLSLEEAVGARGRAAAGAGER